MDVREKAKNDKRLIDANAFLKDILTGGIGKTIIEYSESDIGYMIRKRPTVDAVEVVRCRECKNSREQNEHERNYLVEGVLICTSSDATNDCWNAVWPEHFCSYGERKEGADNG